MDIYQRFGMRANPFSTAPDPEFAYETREHQLATVKILYSIEERLGLFLLQGEIGTGKTTLSRFLFQRLSDDTRYTIAYLTDMSMRTPAQFLREVTSAFGLPVHTRTGDITAELVGFLVRQHTDGKTVVLMIDEAQRIAGPNLHTLHMLSNQETSKHKLLQIVLLSQPNFPNKLEKAPALKSRITSAAYLDPLSFEDAVEMLRYRVEKVGGNFNTLFPGEELHHAIFQATGGSPRDLCVLSGAALVNAAGRGLTCVTPETVAAAINDFRFKFQTRKAA